MRNTVLSHMGDWEVAHSSCVVKNMIVISFLGLKREHLLHVSLPLLLQTQLSRLMLALEGVFELLLGKILGVQVHLKSFRFEALVLAQVKLRKHI